MKVLTATCRTEGCSNAGHPIALEVDDDITDVACGVCAQPIDEVTTS
jgi:hypothetical protein